MNQTEQNKFTEQIEFEKERLQKMGIRLEVIKTFANETDRIFEKTWKEIYRCFEKLEEKYDLSYSELILMSIVLSENAEKHEQMDESFTIAK